MWNGLRICSYVILSTLVCDVLGAPLNDSDPYQICMAKKTKMACDSSKEACMLFLSDVGQKQAKKSCLETARAATQGQQIAPESAPPLAVKKPQQRKKPTPPESGQFSFQRQTAQPPIPKESQSRNFW